MCAPKFPHSIYIFHFISFIHHHQAGKDIEGVRIFFFLSAARKGVPDLLYEGKEMKIWKKQTKLGFGLDRELNPGPLAPEARIIRLDHQARWWQWFPCSFPPQPSRKCSPAFGSGLGNFTLTRIRSRGRVVKALDLKSNGVSPRRFESCRLRNLLLQQHVQVLKLENTMLSGVGFEPTQSFDYESLNLTP